MNITTIQLDRKVKDELFFLKNKIEKKLGKSINYNELIRILLQNNKVFPISNNLKEFRKFKGILSKKVLDTFQVERKLDLESEEKRR
jgi:hypothetical protein